VTNRLSQVSVTISAKLLPPLHIIILADKHQILTIKLALSFHELRYSINSQVWSI